MPQAGLICSTLLLPHGGHHCLISRAMLAQQQICMCGTTWMNQVFSTGQRWVLVHILHSCVTNSLPHDPGAAKLIPWHNSKAMANVLQRIFYKGCQEQFPKVYWAKYSCRSLCQRTIFTMGVLSIETFTMLMDYISTGPASPILSCLQISTDKWAGFLEIHSTKQHEC